MRKFSYADELSLYITEQSIDVAQDSEKIKMTSELWRNWDSLSNIAFRTTNTRNIST